MSAVIVRHRFLVTIAGRRSRFEQTLPIKSFESLLAKFMIRDGSHTNNTCRFVKSKLEHIVEACHSRESLQQTASSTSIP